MSTSQCNCEYCYFILVKMVEQRNKKKEQQEKEQQEKEQQEKE